MNRKKFKVGFYVGQVGPAGADGLVSETLLDMAREQNGPSVPWGDVFYQIRGLEQFNNGESFKGIFAKIRTHDIPHIGSTAGEERKITLHEDEGVIEKNHFLYFRRNELLVYQSNGNGSTLSAFGNYFSTRLNHTTIFQPILKPEAMSRMMRQDLEPTRIELEVARPTNPDQYPDDIWSSDILKLMNGAGGAKIRLTISADGHGRSARRLYSQIKGKIAALVGSGNATTAKIKMAGIEQPIDLIADRIVTTVSVEMDGRYPSESKMFQALRAAKDRSTSELDAIFADEEALA